MNTPVGGRPSPSPSHHHASGIESLSSSSPSQPITHEADQTPPEANPPPPPLSSSCALSQGGSAPSHHKDIQSLPATTVPPPPPPSSARYLSQQGAIERLQGAGVAYKLRRDRLAAEKEASECPREVQRAARAVGGTFAHGPWL